MLTIVFVDVQGNERLGFFLFESVYTEMPVSCTAMAFLHRPAN